MRHRGDIKIPKHVLLPLVCCFLVMLLQSLNLGSSDESFNRRVSISAASDHLSHEHYLLHQVPLHTHVPIERIFPMSIEYHLDGNTSDTPSKRNWSTTAPLLVLESEASHKESERPTEKKYNETENQRACRVQHEWQLYSSSKPTCNLAHELDMNLLSFILQGGNVDKKQSSDYEERLRLVSSGTWRDVWSVREHNNKSTTNGSPRFLALKTLRYEQEQKRSVMDAQRRDAMVAERLTHSANVVDIYTYCGFTGVFEFASGGDIDATLRRLGRESPDATRLERLHIGT